MFVCRLPACLQYSTIYAHSNFTVESIDIRVLSTSNSWHNCTKEFTTQWLCRSLGSEAVDRRIAEQPHGSLLIFSHHDRITIDPTSIQTDESFDISGEKKSLKIESEIKQGTTSRGRREILFWNDRRHNSSVLLRAPSLIGFDFFGSLNVTWIWLNPIKNEVIRDQKNK